VINMAQHQQPVNSKTSEGKPSFVVRTIGRFIVFVFVFIVSVKRLRWKERLVVATVGLALLSVASLHIVSVVQMRSEAKTTMMSSPSSSTPTPLTPSMPAFGVGNPDMPAQSTSTTNLSLTLPSVTAMVGGSRTTTTATENTTATATGTVAVGTQTPAATVAIAPLLIPLGQVGKPHVVGEYGVLVDKAVLICYHQYQHCPSDAARTSAPAPAPETMPEPTPKFIVGLQVNLMSYQGSYYKKKVVAGAVTSLHFLTPKGGSGKDGGNGNSSQPTIPAPASDPRLFYLAPTPPTQANPPASDFRLLTLGEVAILNAQLPDGSRRTPALDLTESGQGAKKELSFGESLSGWLFFEFEYKPKLAGTDAATPATSAGGTNPLPLLLDSKTELEFRFYSNPDTSHTSGIPLRVWIAANQLTVLARF
jgi:hypothetical protein